MDKNLQKFYWFEIVLGLWPNLKSLKISFLLSHFSKVNKTWHKASLGKGIHDLLKEGSDPFQSFAVFWRRKRETSFQSNTRFTAKIVSMRCKTLFNQQSINQFINPIHNNNDNNEIANIDEIFKKSFSLQNHWANFNESWHKAFLCNRDSSFYTNERIDRSQKGDVFIYINQRYWIIMALRRCVY